MPAQSLIEKLLSEWDAGRIHPGPSGQIVIDDEARGWYDGVLGERQTALELSLLGPEWTILHSIPIGERGTDIDHLAIGPCGVFVINSKRHPGKTVTAGGLGMRLDGIGVGHVSSIARQTAQVEGRLSSRCGFAVPVEGILSFVDVRRIVIKAPLGENGTRIWAVHDSQLSTTLHGPRVMSDEQLARLVSVASLPGTWSKSTVSSRPGAHLIQEFAALEQEVDPYLESRGRTRSCPLNPAFRGNRRGRPDPGAARARRRPPRRGSDLMRRAIVGLVTALVTIIVGIIALEMMAHALVAATQVPTMVPTTTPTATGTPGPAP
ncbi:nuclease-related domain-containing protein [Pseudolysinimonas kribbensis]|uniref:nuclease-related domain-containing protein n=1 Tax=Pseudolysinimonas kribbensis TaxID=433641 RepID=UPI0024E0C0F5|nr:nuclease-related domain-containing protein [Pseudolysinimonas kribbensis]